MPRPSLKEERSEEILDAFMRCVARFGLDGSTLDRISQEAGVGRPLLRHYLGNRDQMVTRLIDHVRRKFDALTDDLFGTLPTGNRIESLFNALFVERDHAPENAAVFQALVAASDRHDSLRAPLLRFVTEFERRLASELMHERPDTDSETCAIIAAGIVAIYFNTAAIDPLGPGKSWKDTQQSAARMLFAQL